MKANVDSKSNVRECIISIGDKVLIRQPKKNKLSTPFSPVRYTVIKRKGSMITAASDATGKEVTRNSLFFKKVPATTEDRKIEDDLIDKVCDNSTQDLPDNSDPMSENEPNEDDYSSDDVENGNDQVPRRNPMRERRRPANLRDDIRNLLNT